MAACICFFSFLFCNFGVSYVFFLLFVLRLLIVTSSVIDTLPSTSRVAVLFWVGWGYTTWLFVVGRLSICNSLAANDPGGREKRGEVYQPADVTSYVEGTGYERIYVRHNMVMAILWEDLETRPGGGWWFSFCTHSWNREGGGGCLPWLWTDGMGWDIQDWTFGALAGKGGLRYDLFNLMVICSDRPDTYLILQVGI